MREIELEPTRFEQSDEAKVLKGTEAAAVDDGIGAEILAGRYVQADEAPILYLAPGNGQTKLGYLWTTHKPRGDVIYRWETSSVAKCLENIIPADSTGKTQCDGYAA